MTRTVETTYLECVDPKKNANKFYVVCFLPGTGKVLFAWNARNDGGYIGSQVKAASEGQAKIRIKRKEYHDADIRDMPEPARLTLFAKIQEECGFEVELVGAAIVEKAGRPAAPPSRAAKPPSRPKLDLKRWV